MDHKVPRSPENSLDVSGGDIIGDMARCAVELSQTAIQKKQGVTEFHPALATLIEDIQTAAVGVLVGESDRHLAAGQTSDLAQAEIADETARAAVVALVLSTLKIIPANSDLYPQAEEILSALRAPIPEKPSPVVSAADEFILARQKVLAYRIRVWEELKPILAVENDLSELVTEAALLAQKVLPRINPLSAESAPNPRFKKSFLMANVALARLRENRDSTQQIFEGAVYGRPDISVFQKTVRALGQIYGENRVALAVLLSSIMRLAPNDGAVRVQADRLLSLIGSAPNFAKAPQKTEDLFDFDVGENIETIEMRAVNLSIKVLDAVCKGDEFASSIALITDVQIVVTDMWTGRDARDDAERRDCVIESVRAVMPLVAADDKESRCEAAEILFKLKAPLLPQQRVQTAQPQLRLIPGGRA